jgi:hypothetical protein
MDMDTSTNPIMLDEGFSTLTCKHQTNATSVVAATVAGQIIETSNPFDALQSLGSTHGWVCVAKSTDSLPSKWSKKKPKMSEGFIWHSTMHWQNRIWQWLMVSLNHTKERLIWGLLC